MFYKFATIHSSFSAEGLFGAYNTTDLLFSMEEKNGVIQFRLTSALTGLREAEDSLKILSNKFKFFLEKLSHLNFEN